jgi:hypothetical protein
MPADGRNPLDIDMLALEDKDRPETVEGVVEGLQWTRTELFCSLARCRLVVLVANMLTGCRGSADCEEAGRYKSCWRRQLAPELRKREQIEKMGLVGCKE